MKRRLIIVVALLSILTVSQVSAQTRVGVKAGANFSMMTKKYTLLGTENKADLGTHVGFHVGFTSEIPLIANLYFNPGLFFSSKGYIQTTEVAGYTNKYTFNPYFVEIPLHIMFKLPISNSAIFGYVGPYFSYGIAGNWTNKAELPIVEPQITKDKIKFGSDNGDHMEPFDMGLDVGVGFEVNKFQVSVQYAIGFLNLVPSRPENSTMKMNVLSVSAAYLF
jgi:hypothetical protein